MKFHSDIAPAGRSLLSTLRLWFVFIAFAAAAALVIAALQRADRHFFPRRPVVASAANASTGRAHRPSLPATAFAPTFAEAAGSLRAGRFADAYGRFVALADEGDRDAARIALVMHRFGPELFGSAWDASAEQIADWTMASAAGERDDLAIVRGVAGGSPARTQGDRRRALPVGRPMQGAEATAGDQAGAPCGC